MEIGVVLADFMRPAILFFVLGMISVLLKSDLEIPPAVTKACAIFLLVSIGLEGGMEVVEGVGVRPDLLAVIAVLAIFGIIVSVLTVIVTAKTFKSIVGFKTADAWATAGLYAAVSTVTFMLAIEMATAAQEAAPDELIYGGWMVALNIFLDAPGVIAAIILARLALLRERNSTGAVEVEVKRGKLFHEAVFGCAIWLMLCGLLVGGLAQSFNPDELEDVSVIRPEKFKS